MASAIIATIRSRNQQNLSEEEAKDELQLENFITKLPPEETWDSDFSIGMLVVG